MLIWPKTLYNVEITSETTIPSPLRVQYCEYLNGRRQFKWPHCNLCIAAVGYRTVPWREHCGIKVKLKLSNVIFGNSLYKRNTLFETVNLCRWNIQTTCSQSVSNASTRAWIGFLKSGVFNVDVMLLQWTPCYLPFGIPKHSQAADYMTLVNYVGNKH